MDAGTIFYLKSEISNEIYYKADYLLKRKSTTIYPAPILITRASTEHIDKIQFNLSRNFTRTLSAEETKGLLRSYYDAAWKLDKNFQNTSFPFFEQFAHWRENGILSKQSERKEIFNNICNCIALVPSGEILVRFLLGMYKILLFEIELYYESENEEIYEEIKMFYFPKLISFVSFRNIGASRIEIPQTILNFFLLFGIDRCHVLWQDPSFFSNVVRFIWQIYLNCSEIVYLDNHQAFHRLFLLSFFQTINFNQVNQRIVCRSFNGCKKATRTSTPDYFDPTVL